MHESDNITKRLVDQNTKYLVRKILPEWFKNYVISRKPSCVAMKADLFKMAEKNYGKMSYSDSLHFGKFIDDLCEDDIFDRRLISKRGEMLFMQKLASYIKKYDNGEEYEEIRNL